MLSIKSFNTLRSKIIILTSMVTAIAAISVSVLNYYRTSEQTLEKAVEHLGAKTRLMALRFQDAYAAVQNEAKILSRVPPVRGLMRSIANNGVDPKDGSTTQLWKKRLETTFTSVMQVNPYFTQVRYIGLADDGLELVRVNRTKRGHESVTDEQLQHKGEEPYVKKVKAGLDTFFFSEVTLNREHGFVDKNRLATIRAVVPVKNVNGHVFGMIVINVDYEELLKKMFYSASPKIKAFLTNQSGDYVEYNHKKGTIQLEFHKNYTKKQPEFIKKIQNDKRNEAVYTDGDDVIYYVRMKIIKSSDKEYVGAILQIPKSELLEGVYKTQRESLFFSALLSVLSTMIAALLAHRLTLPLLQLTNSVRRLKDDPGCCRLPTQRKDELGNLAMAFQDTFNKLKQSELTKKAFVDASGDGYWDWLIQEDYEYMSPRFWEMMGYKPEEKKHKPSEWQKLILEEDLKVVLDNFDKHVKTKGQYPYSQEVRYRHKDGSIITVLCKGAVVEWTKEGIPTRMVGTHTDMTEIKSTQSQLEMQNKELQCLSSKLKELNQSLEQEIEKRVYEFKKVNEELLAFSYIISHDFREPLRGIRQFSELLMDEYLDNLPAEAQEFLHIVYSSAVKSTNLLDSLTKFAKIDKNNDKGQVINVKELIDIIVADNKNSILQNNIKVYINNKLPHFKGSRVHLHEMLKTLIENAIRYSDAKKDEKWINIHYCDEDNVLRIEDNGISIPSDKLNECQNLFYKINPESEGLGMGLAICKKLALVNNIEFKLYNNQWGGVTATLKLQNNLINDHEM